MKRQYVFWSFQVIEQGDDVWKGVVISDHRRMSKPGYFPPDHVVLIDSTGMSTLIMWCL